MKNNKSIDENTNYPRCEDIDIVVDQLKVNRKDIVDIAVLKKGMTNRSFTFCCNNKRYIMRIPGEGTDKLINRQEEAAVYEVIKEQHISDDVLYINKDNGYKITVYMDNSRTCDSCDYDDLVKAMAALRRFHGLKLIVKHKFDIFAQIEFYESLWNGNSIYQDYALTKAKIFSLQSFIDANTESFCLTHIDAVPDNFLFMPDGSVRLIDWEYAGMQDPHVDIAMFCIYALYDKSQVDQLINIYFENACPNVTRIKIYSYIAVCGLLWSNWCEYKHSLGVEFGEYAQMQYRYAKEYYNLVQNELHSFACGEEQRG